MNHNLRISVGYFAAAKTSTPRNLMMTLAVFGALTAFVCFALSSTITSNNFAAAAAQEMLEGEWTAEVDPQQANTIRLMFHRRTKQGGNSMSNTDIPLVELHGLTSAQAFSAGAPVNFRIVREAGTFTQEGYFREGKGSGQWRLKLNDNFIFALRARGYDNLREEQLLAAAMHNLTARFIEDLASAGYARPPFDELLAARIFNVTPEFIREIGALGYERLPLQELVSARIFKVDAAFAGEVRDMGFGRQPLKKLVALRIHGVTESFISEIKAEGFDRISADDAVQLRIFKVNSEFIRRMKARGFTDLTLNQLVQLRIHNIAN